MAFTHRTCVRSFTSRRSPSHAASSRRKLTTLSLSTCRVCKKVFPTSENNPRACRFHPATWTGAERSKFYGRIPEISTLSAEALQVRGVEYFYDCCDARSPDDPGCCFGFHRTYDE